MEYADLSKTVPPTYENGQDIRDRTFEFACRVVAFSQEVKALVQEGSELVAIIGTIIRNKRRSMAAKSVGRHPRRRILNCKL